MAFKSEIHVAELASIHTGHTEGDIYYILDNGMLGDLPCKPGTFVKWHNDAWQILPGEHYALGSVVDTIAQAVERIGQPLQWKGPATVAQLNAGITGIQPGWTYTLTDAGTLTDGSIVVDVGDEVSWTEDDEWFKIGGDGGVKVLHGSSNPGGTTYPDAQDVVNAVAQGKEVLIFWNSSGNLYVYRLEYMSGYSTSGDDSYVFRCIEDYNQAKVLTQSGGVYTWSYRIDDKIPYSDSIAPRYSDADTYAVGDYCMHAGLLYICNTAIATAEDWTPAHWTETSVVAQKATIGPNGVFIGSRKIHPGSKLFVEGLPVDAVDYALVDKYNAFIYNRITAFADSGTVTLGLWNYDSKAYVSEQQLSTDSDNPTVIDVSAANASDTMEIHLKGTGVIDHITGSIT